MFSANETSILKPIALNSYSDLNTGQVRSDFGQAYMVRGDEELWEKELRQENGLGCDPGQRPIEEQQKSGKKKKKLKKKLNHFYGILFHIIDDRNCARF